MQPTRMYSLLAVLVLLLQTASTTGSVDEERLVRARSDFLAAEKALQSGDLERYRNLIKELSDYPLLPYLEYQEAKRDLASATPVTIKTQLLKLKDTPLRGQLKSRWLKQLAKKRQWKTYLDFSTPGGTITQRCRHLQALLETGQRDQAFSRVEPIWLSGRSRPKACDPVFEAWIDAGHLHKALVWKRIGLAMAARQTRLARYLKRFLPTEDQPWVEHWITLHRHPERIEQILGESHPMRDEVIAHAVRRLARKNIQQALSIWEKVHTDPTFSDQQQLSVARTLATYVVRQPEGELLHRLDELVPPHLRLDPKLSDKWFQAALQQNDWNRVLATIDNLSDEEQAKERWRYWKARALLQLGQSQEGEKLLKTLTKERSYYGFLAADRIGDSLPFHHQPLTIDPNRELELARTPGLIRARELKAMGRDMEARREWNLALRNGSAEELKAAAKLATDWDWPSQTIFTLARIKQWNDLELRFPLQHRQQVDRQAQDNGIESAWIYAILRQESAFMTDARSSAGALGLMQLMPRTARQVAYKTKQGPIKKGDLFQPGINIALGTSYLTQVYQRLQENPVLATAAYNAGPHRVLTWLPEETQSTDVWIETVPFKETREYLKRVLSYTLIYTHRLGGDPVVLPKRWMKPIKADSDTGIKGQFPPLSLRESRRERSLDLT